MGDVWSDELFAAIVGAPDDDAARLVFADWLLERGDPRGELIVLQCKTQRTRHEDERIATLIRENASSWLGDLERVVSRRFVPTFERGFLAELPLRPLPEAIANQTSTIALVERITLSLEQLPETSPFRAWFLRQPTRSLRSLRGADRALAVSLLSGAPRPQLTTLGLFFGASTSTTLAQLTAALTNGRGLPSLRTIAIHDVEIQPLDTVGWIFDAVLRDRAPLTVHVYGRDPVRYIAALEERYHGSKSVKELLVGGPNEYYHHPRQHLGYVVSQDKKGSWSILRITNAESLESVVETLKELPPWSVRRVLVALDHLPGGRSPSNVARLRDAARHLPRVQIEVV